MVFLENQTSLAIDALPITGGFLLYDSDNNILKFKNNIGTATIISSDINGNVDIPLHNGSSIGLKLGGTLITATANEINILDGVTITSDELNYLDLTIGPGIAEANKSLVLDTNKDINNINILSAQTINTNTLNITNILNNLSEGGLVIKSYSNNNMSGRIIKQEVISDIDLTNYNPTGQIDNYSIEITGYIKPAYSETYTFYITSNNGDRIWINNILLHNKWLNNANDESSISISLIAEQWYPIKIHNHNISGLHRLLIQWYSPTQIKAKIPLNRMAWDNTQYPLSLNKSQIADSLTLFNSITDLANTCEISIDSNGNCFIKPSNNFVGIEVNDSSNNTPLDILRIIRTTSGIASSGIGSGLRFDVENDNGITQHCASINAIFTDTSNTAEDSKLTISLYDNGTYVERAILDNTGQLFVTNLIETSDRRVKENITLVNNYESYKNINKIEIVDYNFINDPIKKKHRGVIAQDLHKIIPTAISIRSNNNIPDLHAVSSKEILGHLLSAFQFLSSKVEYLENENIKLKQKMNDLELHDSIII
jgi:hypothetical protein